MSSRRLSQRLTGTRNGQIATVYYNSRGVVGVIGLNAGQEMTLYDAVSIAFDPSSGQYTARVDRRAVDHLANAGVQIRLAKT